MAARITLKKSSVVAKVPTASDLEYGELALNYADGKLYYKNSSNEVKCFIDSDLIQIAISNGPAGGGTDSYILKGSIDLTASGDRNLGQTLPANADVIQTTLLVSTASDVVTTVAIGDSTNGIGSYMDSDENDPEVLGNYVAHKVVSNGGAGRTLTAKVTNPGTVGSAICFVEYR